MRDEIYYRSQQYSPQAAPAGLVYYPAAHHPYAAQQVGISPNKITMTILGFVITGIVGPFAVAMLTDKFTSKETTVVMKMDECADAGRHWESTEADGTRSAYQEHLHQFPHCKFLGIAQQRIAAIDRVEREQNDADYRRAEEEQRRAAAEARRIQQQRQAEAKAERDRIEQDRIARNQAAREQARAEAERQRLERERVAREQAARALADAESRRLQSQRALGFGGWLGVQLQSVSVEFAESQGLNEVAGAIIAEVIPNSPAAVAGIKPYDVVSAINGYSVRDADDLALRVGNYTSGTSVGLRVIRNGISRVITVALGHSPSAGRIGVAPPRLGVTLSQVTNGEKGLKIESVEAGSLAEDGRLRMGDIILEVGGMVVETADDIRIALITARDRGNEPY